MVFPLNSKLKVTNLSKTKYGSVVIDGKVHYNIGYLESIEVKKSENKINFIRFEENYIKRVREKLLRFNLDDRDE